MADMLGTGSTFRQSIGDTELWPLPPKILFPKDGPAKDAYAKAVQDNNVTAIIEAKGDLWSIADIKSHFGAAFLPLLTDLNYFEYAIDLKHYFARNKSEFSSRIKTEINEQTSLLSLAISNKIAAYKSSLITSMQQQTSMIGSNAIMGVASNTADKENIVKLEKEITGLFSGDSITQMLLDTLTSFKLESWQRIFRLRYISTSGLNLRTSTDNDNRPSQGGKSVGRKNKNNKTKNNNISYKRRLRLPYKKKYSLRHRKQS
jgi:hypothetical protein